MRMNKPISVQDKALVDMYKRGEIEKHSVKVKLVNPNKPDDEESYIMKEFTFYKTKAEFFHIPSISKDKNGKHQPLTEPDPEYQ